MRQAILHFYFLHFARVYHPNYSPRSFQKRQLKKMEIVDLISHFKNETRISKRFYVIPYDIPKQCTATYFPETNVLVPLKSKADLSNTPASKTVIITIHKH